ncbi:sigma-70 family RNA polymerase sigma factor [Streptomyces sp. HNM0574]|uniref:sigma-70 family RNA polymerase sigma factor n=1 Tax=Streptomyces sp. HNM0574 TaxID=2714954 RepID=UPI00146AD7C0|nr:sigma-70 family RNA polymerase sigma factor [Streptomyces sp. HNM0574]NLU70996.1 sigma-70 family RNA polymerase sigma factor [Streptomyces sp. HNM0574]
MPTRRSSTSSDAELTARIRDAHETPRGPEGGADGEAGDGAALDELFRRHRPAVLAYARTCCRDPHTAEDLASEAFTRTLSAVRAGGGPTDAWRPYLLTTVRRTAAAWADTARRTQLTADVERELEGTPAADSGEDRMLQAEDGQLVLRAFQSLPERWQAALWHTTVEEEPAPRVAELLGISPSGVTSLTARAREGLREAYLTVHAERTDGAGGNDECRRYTGLLAASVRRTGRRPNKDLERHLADCPQCRTARLELTQLNSSLRAVLPTALLLWGTTAYLTKATTTAVTATTTGTATGAVSGAGGISAKTAGVLAASAASVAALTVGGFLLFSGGDDTSARAPAASPPVTTPAVPTDRPTTSPPSRDRKPARDAPTTSPARTSAPPSWSPGADARTRLRVMATGRCMDIAPQEGAAPRETTCDGGTSQRWELLIDRPAQEARIRNLATGMCLTHTDSTADGAPVRQRPCDDAESAPYTRWTYFQKPDNIVFAQKANRLYFLGLDDWHAAAQGKPHQPTIGTTANYYNTESLRFRYDGDLTDG